MTLTVALAVEKGMVCATDSRGTIGDPRVLTAQNDTIKKQYVLARHTVLQISGQNETEAMLIEEIERWCGEREKCTTTEVMTKASEIFIRRYNEWFPNIPPQPIAQVILSNDAH